MGNHEEKALRWRRHEAKRKADPKHYKNPMSSINEKRLAQWAAISDEDWDWLAKCPAYIDIDDEWTAVHGGCMPGLEMNRQAPNELMRLRYVKTVTDQHGYPKYKMASLNEAGEAPEDCVHWTSLWNGPRKIVYGHYTRENILITQFTAGLDTGCVHGGHLTAMFVDTITSFVSIKANEVYVERRPWNDSMD